MSSTKDTSARQSVYYRTYLLSPEWLVKREARLEVDGHKCVRCGRCEFLEVHHLTYERLGQEEMEDLETVCEACHEDIHGTISTVRRLRRRQEKYREVFRENNGTRPWPCYFTDLTGCLHDGKVYDVPGLKTNSFVVHHIDESGTSVNPNNDPFNLVAAHHGCHTRYHFTGKRLSSAHRSKLAAAHKRRGPVTKETRAKLSLARKGNNNRWKSNPERKDSAETLAKKRAAALRRWGTIRPPKHETPPPIRTPKPGDKPWELGLAAIDGYFTCSLCGRVLRGKGNLHRHEGACSRSKARG